MFNSSSLKKKEKKRQVKRKGGVEECNTLSLKPEYTHIHYWINVNAYLPTESIMNSYYSSLSKLHPFRAEFLHFSHIHILDEINPCCRALSCTL